MNLKYNILIFLKDDKLIHREFITNSLSANSFLVYLYNNFRNFNKLYNCEVNTYNVEKFSINSIIDLFEINTDKFDQEYFVNIEIDKDIANIFITNDQISTIYKQVIINDKYSGNCVTDFINRGIQPIINELINYSNDIKDRHEIRIKDVEYNDSACYEKDYAQTIKIKNLAEKIVLLCNKELQHLVDVK